MIPAETLQRPEIRRTLLQALLSCGAAEPSSGGEAAAFGQVAHDFIARYWAACLALGQEEHRTGVEQLASQAFHAGAGVDPNRWPEFLQLCQDFADVHLLGAKTLIAYEKPLAVDVGWAILNGRLDRLDRSDDGDPDDDPTRITIVDWKTQIPVEPFVFQGGVYAQLVFLNYPSVEEVEWQLDFIRRRTMPDPVIYERGQLDSWWEGVVSAAEKIWHDREAGRAMPTGGAACQYCAKRYECAAAVRPASLIPESDDQAEEIISDWLRLQAGVDEREKALKAFFAERSPLLVNGLEVGFLSSREPTPSTADPEAVIEWLNTRSALPLEGEVALRTSIDWTKVPRTYWPELVEAGLAEIPDRISFKARKAAAQKPLAAEPGAPASPRQLSPAEGERKGKAPAAVAGAGSAAGESLAETITRLRSQKRVPKGGFQ